MRAMTIGTLTFLLTSCSRPMSVPSKTIGPVQTRSDTTPMIQFLRGALKQAAPSLSLQIDAAAATAIHVTPDSSVAFPGVVYKWVTFAPPASGDYFVQALLAPVGDSLVVLRTTEDWQHLADRMGWRPGSADDAVAGCWDLVRNVGPYRNVAWPPALYRDSTSLRHPMIEGAVELRRRLSPPEVMRNSTGGGWDVTAWFLESGRVGRYECHLDGSATFQSSEEIKGFGFPRLGP